MFELLLQADKALADGHLDQAERTYGQLVELDPSNAIAVAGMARVWLERGDELRARVLADRALSIDPDSVAARRVIDTIEGTTVAPAGPQPQALPIQAAEKLEALSRRHVGKGTEAGATAQQGRRATKDTGKTESAGDYEPELAEPGPLSMTPTPAGRTGRGSATSNATGPQAAAGPQMTGSGKDVRGRTRPDQMAPMPAEPLRERRQAGRLAAAAAAAAAAAREPVPARRQPHHAMPVGRRFFGAEDPKTPGADAFAEAEMAAAVAAVDALDDLGAGPPETEAAPAFSSAGPSSLAPRAGGLDDVVGAVDATGADESGALRVALVGDAAAFEAAEREAAWPAAPDAAPGSVPEKAAEAEPAEPEAAEPEAAEPEAADAWAADEVAGMEAEEAERAAAAEAVNEVANAADNEEAPPLTPRRPLAHRGAEEPSEEEAEAAALREAMEIVLDGDREGSASERPLDPAPPNASPDAIAAAAAGAPDATAAPAASNASGRPGDADRTDADAGSRPAKKGLFHRIRGD